MLWFLRPHFNFPFEIIKFTLPYLTLQSRFSDLVERILYGNALRPLMVWEEFVKGSFQCYMITMVMKKVCAYLRIASGVYLLSLSKEVKIWWMQFILTICTGLVIFVGTSDKLQWTTVIQPILKFGGYSVMKSTKNTYFLNLVLFSHWALH